MLASMSTAFGQQLRRIRTQKGVTLKALGEAAGRSESWASNVETGKIAEPPYTAVVRMARRLGVAPEELYTDVAPEGDAGAAGEPLEAVLHRIGAHPLADEPAIELDQAVAAGRHGAGILQDAEEGARRRRRRHEPRRYLVRIDGDCLEPRASRGDYAVFDPEQPAEPGALVVVAHGDQALVKYLAAQDAVQWLMPLVGEPIQLLPEMRIVGVVTEIRRGPGRSPGAPKRRG